MLNSHHSCPLPTKIFIRFSSVIFVIKYLQQLSDYKYHVIQTVLLNILLNVWTFYVDGCMFTVLNLPYCAKRVMTPARDKMPKYANPSVFFATQIFPSPDDCTPYSVWLANTLMCVSMHACNRVRSDGASCLK